MNGAGSTSDPVRCSNAAFRTGIASQTSETRAAMSWVALTVPSTTRFNMFSMDQETSLTCEAPTMRPLPFRV